VIFFSKKELREGVFVKDDTIWIRWHDFNSEVINLADIPSHIFTENVMAVIALCAAAGTPLKIIAKGIKDFRAVEHRLEFVRELNGVIYYNDSKATNIDSALKAIDRISALGKSIVLIAGGQDKKLDFGDLIRSFPNRVKSVIVLGEVTEEIIQTCHAYNFHSYERANTLKDAIDIAKIYAVAGDAVLLSPACASQDMFKNYEHRGNMFKELVHNLQ